jgi:hypothetical protein
METKPLVVETTLVPEDMVSEDGGSHKSFRVMTDPDGESGVVVELSSWDDDANHPQFDMYVGKKVRITVEIIN